MSEVPETELPDHGNDPFRTRCAMLVSVLAMCLAMPTADSAPWHWVLPPHSAEEAALMPEARVYRAQHLRDVVQAFLPHSGRRASRALTSRSPSGSSARWLACSRRWSSPARRKISGSARPSR